MKSFILNIKKFVKTFLLFILKYLTYKPFKVHIFSDELKNNHFIKFNDIKINYSASSELCFRRWKAFEKNGKEEDTINWINNFKNESIFYDIGANVGVFTLYAAIKKKCKVYSFEPEPNSFIDLYNSIKINKDIDVLAMLIPLDDEKNTNFFNLNNNFISGHSGHKFGDLINGKSRYAICSDTIYNLIKNNIIKSPDYIKIDVDGTETKILNGMKDFWSDNKLKSILIEFNNTKDLNYYSEFLNKYGFFLQQRDNGNNFNYIFSRK